MIKIFLVVAFISGDLHSINDIEFPDLQTCRVFKDRIDAAKKDFSIRQRPVVECIERTSHNDLREL